MHFPKEILPWKLDSQDIGYSNVAFYKPAVQPNLTWSMYDHITIPVEKQGDGFRHTGFIHVTVRACQEYGSREPPCTSTNTTTK
jgi:hypothetical protein